MYRNKEISKRSKAALLLYSFCDTVNGECVKKNFGKSGACLLMSDRLGKHTYLYVCFVIPTSVLVIHKY
jgi:hypothetical protein